MGSTALQIDALWAGLNDPDTGQSYSGAIVAFFESGTTTPKAVWLDKDKTLPTTAGLAQTTLSSNGIAKVYGDGTYKINIYAPTDTGLTTPLSGSIDEVTYTIPQLQTFDTVADLILITESPTDGTVSNLLGYFEPGDGGGGQFYWDATSSATDNGGTVIKATSIAIGRWMRLLPDGQTIIATWFGIIDDGVTDVTAKIDDALATGKSLHFPYIETGTYLTNGAHRISFDGQVVSGDAGYTVTIKRSSGTNTLLDTEFGQLNVGIKDIGFDGDGAAGNLVEFRGHHSWMKNVFFRETGGTDYALRVSGVNLSDFSDLKFLDANNYGGLLIDQLTDSYSPQPIYGCLYSSFNNVSVGETNGGSNIKTAGAQVQMVIFTRTYVEGSQSAVNAPIDIGGTNNANIVFDGITGEPVTLQTPMIKVDSIASYNIDFRGGRLSVNAINTDPYFSILNCQDVTIRNFLFLDIHSAADTRSVIDIQSAENVVIEDNITSFVNDFTFINDVSGNRYITDRNNRERVYAPHPGIGTNNWSNVEHLILNNSGMVQEVASTVTHLTMNTIPQEKSQVNVGGVTIADDGFYDIFGDGGVTSPGANFQAVLTIMGGTTTSTSQNNFATFYAQTAQTSNAQQKQEIKVGSNFEVAVLPDTIVCALVNTIDGYLGVQIGGGSTTARAVRLYNRTGAEIYAKIHVHFLEEGPG